jgi:hypothetical protein
LDPHALECPACHRPTYRGDVHAKNVKIGTYAGLAPAVLALIFIQGISFGVLIFILLAGVFAGGVWSHNMNQNLPEN